MTLSKESSGQRNQRSRVKVGRDRMLQKEFRLANQPCIFKCLRRALSLFAVGGLFIASSAFASATLPSMRIMVGNPVTPDAAAAYYGLATATTSGLCQSVGYTSACQSNSGVVPRAPELKELARALHHDPNLIYEYVRNSVQTEFMFGSHKGALGAMIDSSGGAFDQAELLVELLRESGYTARFDYGDITLTGDQFYAWSGVQSAQAACQLLSSGGIPVVVNGVTGTCSISGNVSSITLSHVWVEADINGATYQFDPAFKVNTIKSGIALSTAAGVSAGQSVGAATSGMTSGTTPDGFASISNMNTSSLHGVLSTYATNISNRLAQADLQGADMSDIVGGYVLEPAQRPAGGWQQTSLSYVSHKRATWSSIPDQFRAQVAISTLVPASSNAPNFTVTLFGDEVYGRRIDYTVMPDDSSTHNDGVASLWQASLLVDFKVVKQGADYNISQAESGTELTFAVNHPFAGADSTDVAGSYGDVSITKMVDQLQPASIVLGWGNVSPALEARWSTENNLNVYSFVSYRSGVAPTDGGAGSSSDGGQVLGGDLTRAKANASWLAQFSKALDIQSRIGGGLGTHLHTIGVASSDSVTQEQALMGIICGNYGCPTTPGYGIELLDNIPVSLDLETAIAVTSTTNNALNRRASIHAIAQVAATLEGSVAQQLTDSPDIASTSRRLGWGNNPEAADTSSATPRSVFFAAHGGVVNSSSLTADGSTGNPPGIGSVGAIDPSIVSEFRAADSQYMDSYLENGFDLVASQDALLGPGHIVGSQVPLGQDNLGHRYIGRLPSLQRGGAFIANQYDVHGDPIAIAHIITRLGSEMKGGGGPLPNTGVRYDPAEAMRSLKDKFVDRSSFDGVDLSSGLATYQSPVLESVGQGSFPDKLERNIEVNWTLFSPSPGGGPSSGSDPRLANTFTSLDGSLDLSTSGLEALGEGRVSYATSALAAFVALQDIYSATPSSSREMTGAMVADWWSQAILDNVVTVYQGASSSQYVRTLGTTYLPVVGGDYAQVTGTPEIVRPQIIVGASGRTINGEPLQSESITRQRLYDTVAVTVTGEHGDLRQYAYWSFQSPDSSTLSASLQGFRLSQWVFPKGITLTYTYPAPNVDSPETLPASVTSSLGLALNLTRPAWSSSVVAQGASYNSSIAFTDLANDTYQVVRTVINNTGATRSAELAVLPNASFTTRPSPRCCIIQTFLPDNTSTANVSYGYDTIGRVNTISDGIAIRNPSSRNPYQLYIAEGYRGERVDPVGGSYSVLTERNRYLKLYTDEIGRTTQAVLDGRGRTVSHTFPEGDQDVFQYDANDNTIQNRHIAAPCSALCPSPADIIESAIYDPTWNKPVKLADANRHTTDLTYAAAGQNGAGELLQVVQPNPISGAEGGGAVTSFTYDAYGHVLSSTNPIGLVIQNTYDSNGFLTKTVTDPNNVAATMAYTNDAIGNVIEAVGPRTDIVQDVYTTYDAMRRPLFDVGVDPDGTGSLVRKITHHMYDVDGREYRTEIGTGTATNGSDFSITSYTLKTFDAVSNVIQTTLGQP